MARRGLTPGVLAVDHKEDGATILVQQYIEGRVSGWADGRQRLRQVGNVLGEPHLSEQRLVTVPSDHLVGYEQRGVRALATVGARREGVGEVVTDVANSVDHGLTELEQRIKHFRGSGL